MSTDRCWNRCDRCNRFIPYVDFENGRAVRRHVKIFASTIDEYEHLVRSGDDMETECIGSRRAECNQRAVDLWQKEAWAL